MVEMMQFAFWSSYVAMRLSLSVTPLVMMGAAEGLRRSVVEATE